MVKEKAEEKRKEGLHWFIKRMVAVFATFFVVIGVALIGILAKDTMPKIVEEITQATSTQIYAPAFLIVSDSGSAIYNLDGEFIRDLVWSSDTNIFDLPVSQMKGVDLNSGKVTWLTSGFSIASSTKFRSPDGRREVRLEERRKDGSVPMVVSYGNNDDLRVLRYGGDLIKDIEPVGWMGDKKFIFLGNATETKAVFVLDLGSSVSYVSPASKTAWDYQIFGKDIFYLDSNLSEDDDSKVAPGSLHRIGINGEVADLVHNDDSVIQSYVVGEDAIFYTLANQSMYKKTGSDEVLLGKCVPLLIMPQARVVCRAGDSVEIRGDNMEPKRLFGVKNATIMYLDRVRMDEQVANEVN